MSATALDSATIGLPIVPRRPGDGRATRTAWAQAALYTTTGAWPLLSLRSFEAVTGPKREDWLVQTFGAVLAVVGAGLAAAAARDRITPEIRLIAAGCAATLAAADVVFVAKRRISPVYLLDAVAEVGLAASWLRPRPL
jgi:hypothetical protein